MGVTDNCILYIYASFKLLVAFRPIRSLTIMGLLKHFISFIEEIYYPING